MKKIILLLFPVMLFNVSFGQKWAEMMQQPGANFYDIQKAFNDYWKDKDVNVPGNGYKAFKRWEYFMEPRVYPTGDLSLPSQAWKNFEEFQYQNSSQKGGVNLIASTTWTAMGPFGAMSGVASNGFPRKAGRDNFITFHPTNTSIIYAGAPAGGLWVTTNLGSTWATNTDNLSVTGCTDLAIDPTNPNTMYLATGDGDAGDTYCIGVLKSTNGGTVWNPTGLVFTVNQLRTMRRLIINPSNPQILLAATNVGVYRTTDAGVNWTLVAGGSTFDLEFKPGNPNTVYAAGTTFSVSTNGGLTFTQVSTGIPTTGVNRMGIAVTPADANYVYVVASLSSNSGLQGFYRSVNSGAAFTLMASTPNLLANPCAGTGTGGQGWYDLCIAASPLNKDEAVVGGVNVWRTTNGGTAWSSIGCWIGTGTPPYVHADHHELEYTAAGVLYSGNDGGIFRYTGTAWTDITAPRNIAQIYKIGLSTLSPNLWITGHQDNGSNIYNSGTYNASMAGDGMDCFIDRTNNLNMFASYYQGQFQRSTNGGGSWSSAQGGMTGGAAWVAPWKQDPSVAARLYAGRTQMWVSANSGVSWTQLTATGGSGNIVEFAIAPSNNQILYVIHGTNIFKTINGGTSWTNVTGTIPVASAAPSFITIDPTDPNNVWVTLSGYSAANKVFVTTNGGTSWTNYTSNLPNLPANCSVYQPGTSDRIYVGMDVGVYYRDNTQGTWTLYNAGMPNTPVFDMEISPASSGKVRAATYGRGVYEVDVAPTNVPPVSNFSVASSVFCTATNYVFSDQSSNTPTSWIWAVNPSTGVTITTPTSQNPTFNFSNAGVYSVSLTASNGSGTGNTIVKSYTVNAKPTVLVANNSQTVCVGSAVIFTASGAAAYSWSNGGGTGTSATYFPSSSSTYTVTGTSNGCSSTALASVTTKTLPVVSAAASNTMLCAGQSATLNASGASTYTWNPGGMTGASTVVSPGTTITYTVTGTGSNACNNTGMINITVSTCAGVGQLADGKTIFSVYPNPTSGKLTLLITSAETVQTVIEVLDVRGRSVWKQSANVIAGESVSGIDISNLASGTYYIKLNSSEGSSSLVKIIKE